MRSNYVINKDTPCRAPLKRQPFAPDARGAIKVILLLQAHSENALLQSVPSL